MIQILKNASFLAATTLPILLSYVLTTHPLYAQPSASRSQLEETGIWNGLYLKVKISRKIGYYGEHHYRVRNRLDNLTSFVGRTRQIYNRAGINLFFNEYFEAVIGPTLVFNFSPEPGNENFERVTLEPRIWHQWLFAMPPMGRFRLFHQFRFEHRWRRSNRKGAEYEYTDRYRYKFFAFIPINKKRSKTAPCTSRLARKSSCNPANPSFITLSKTFALTTALGTSSIRTLPSLLATCGRWVKRPPDLNTEQATSFALMC